MITLPTYDIEEAGHVAAAVPTAADQRYALDTIAAPVCIACKARDAVGSSGRFQAPSGGEG